MTAVNLVRDKKPFYWSSQAQIPPFALPRISKISPLRPLRRKNPIQAGSWGRGEGRSFNLVALRSSDFPENPIFSL